MEPRHIVEPGLCRVYEFAGVERWNGSLEWSGGMEQWSGVEYWSAGRVG